MTSSPTITKIAVALLQAQKEMEVVIKSADNPYYKSKYADINSFLESMVPVLNKVGIVVLQPVYSTEHGTYVETTLVHESGETYSSGPLKLELDKTDMQKLGSAITYARRYSLQSLLGARAQDDDGEATMSRTKATVKSPEKNYPTSTKFAEAAVTTNHAAAGMTVSVPQNSGVTTTELNGSTLPKKGGFSAFKKAAEAKATGNGNGLF